MRRVTAERSRGGGPRVALLVLLAGFVVALGAWMLFTPTDADPAAVAADPVAVASTSPEVGGSPVVRAPAGPVGEPGLCIEVTSGALPADAWSALRSTVLKSADERPDLFPAPVALALPDPMAHAIDRAESMRIGVWSELEPGTDEEHLRSRLAGMSCVAPGAAWSARITLDLLRAGADRRAATVELAPGTSADVDVTFHPDEGRVRTFLDFELPLGIGGICWLDDVLTVDPATATAGVVSSAGMDVTMFAEYGCERFMALMPDGGAGEQAVTLVPAEVTLDDGTIARMVADRVDVSDLAITVSGLPSAPGFE